MIQAIQGPPSPMSKKTRANNAEKQAKVKFERDKVVEMIECFYDKARTKIEKALNKDSKRTLLVCKELFSTFSLHPKQELFQINQLSDVLFNEMAKINQIVVDCIKAIEALMVKMSSQLNIQKEKAMIKQQKQMVGDYQIAVLRKIVFKKQKTSVRNKLKDINTLNKKIVKFQQNTDQLQVGSSIEIDGKRLDGSVLRYKNVWFECKKREYILCICGKKGNNQEGQLTLFNDKLQTITQFGHVPPINLNNLIDILQSQNFLFIVHSHSILRISLVSEQDCMSQVFVQQIKRAQVFCGNVVLWVCQRPANHSILILTQEMEMFYQEYLMLNIKEICYHFRIDTRQGELMYFIARCLNGSFNLFRVEGVEIKLVLKDIGQIDEVVPFRVQNRTQYVLFRKGGEFYRFSERELSKRLLQIDMQGGETMVKCCILGGLFYCLHQSGKYLLQCHFKVGQCQQTE